MEKKVNISSSTNISNSYAGSRSSTSSDFYEIDLIELLLAYKKNILFILVLGLIGANIAILYTRHMVVPTYESKCKMFILTRETTISSIADLNIGTQLTQDYFILAKSRPVLNKVIANLDLDMDYEELLPKLTLSNPSDSHILELAVADSDPRQAQVLVNEIACVSADYISKKMEVAIPHIIEEGEIPYTRISPNMSRNVLLGGCVGLVLGLAFVTIIFLFNDTITSDEDIEQYLGLYMLAAIPDNTSRIRKINGPKKQQQDDLTK